MPYLWTCWVQDMAGKIIFDKISSDLGDNPNLDFTILVSIIYPGGSPY